jgi:hypothetical protein
MVKRPLALLLFAVALSSFVVAQVPTPPPFTKKETSPATEPPAPKNSHEMTAADVEAFLDGIVPLQLKHSDIATSGGLGDSPRANLWEAFLDRYYSYSVQAGPAAGSQEAAKTVSGTYTLSRRSETSFFKTASCLVSSRSRPQETATSRCRC